MISDFWSHRALCYRPRGDDDISTRDDSGDVLQVFDEVTVPMGLNCLPDQSWSGSLTDRGPGEQQSATRRWFLDAGFHVKERDVLEVTTGLEAPVLLRVLSVTQCGAPIDLHHYEVNVEVCFVALREEAGSS